MSRKIYIPVYIGILGFLLFAGTSGNYVLAQSNTRVAVIVHKDNPIQSIDEGEVKLYYLRKLKKRWPQIDKSIRPVDRAGKPEEQKIFFSKVLKMTKEEVDQYFIEKKTANAEMPPDKFNTDREVLEYVKNNIGAIAYVNENSVNDQVKVILTVK